MSANNRNEKSTAKHDKSKRLWIKIMAWVLSILMAGSVATLTISMFFELFAH